MIKLKDILPPIFESSKYIGSCVDVDSIYLYDIPTEKWMIKLKDILNETQSKQKIDEGFLYRIWSKIVDATSSESTLLLPIGAGTVSATLISTGNAWLILPLLAIVAGAMGLGKIDDLLRTYFRSKYFDKNLQPIVDELIPAISNDGTIKQHMENIKRIKNELEKIGNEYQDVPRRSKGAPEKRRTIQTKREQLDGELMELSKKLNTRISAVMKNTGATQKIKSALPTDKDSFAGDKWGDEKFYRADVKDKVMAALEPNSSELNAIQRDIDQMKESIQRKHGSLL